MGSVYLDYNATTPVDRRVLEVMMPYFTEKFGNASSKTHSFGWIAEDAVEQAREQTASLLNATPHEIIFTSGATESINMALKGVFEAYSSKGNHIIVLQTEHKAVLDVCRYLESRGAEITYLPVDRQGSADPEALIKAVKASTILISAIYANNETGTIQPVKEIGQIAHRNNILFMCDATQAAGKVIVDVVSDRIDILALSAHKIYGPKGTGALYIRRRDPRVTLVPFIHGGGHERGFRSGTLNVPGIVGLGAACALAKEEMWDDNMRISSMRTFLEQELLAIGNVYVNGSQKQRLPNTTHLSFEGISNSSLIKELPEIAVATGSACTSAAESPSHVLKAMQVEDALIKGSVRFSLGRFTREEDIEYTIGKVRTAVNKLRGKHL